MTPRPLTVGDRVMILAGVLPDGWIIAITEDRCSVQTAASLRIVFCDQVVRLAPRPRTIAANLEGQP